MIKTLKRIMACPARTKYAAFIALAVMFAGGAGFFFAGHSIKALPADKNFSVALSGFEPGALVNLRILEQNSEPMQTTARIDNTGALNVPMEKDLSNVGSDIIYDFSVQEANRDISVLLRHDLTTGQVSVEGNAGNAFDVVEIGIGTEDILTHSDWAGLFAQTGISMRADPAKNTDAPLRLAFLGTNRLNDSRDAQNSSFIKVQLVAPGGGTAGSGGVNNWTAVLCAPYPLSVCNVGAVNAQNQNIVENFVFPMMLMAEQISAVAMQQTAAIGKFIDAKQQLENQRTHQKLKAEAVKDYHPSEQMCRIGSYVRSLATIEEKMAHDQFVLNDILIEHETNRFNTVSRLGQESDHINRLEQFKTTYCDPKDNNASLEILCDNGGGSVGAANRQRVNKDVDYQRTLEFPYTLDIDFSDRVLTDDEEDVIALGRNLYWPDVFQFATEDDFSENSKYYARARSLRALNNLAHSSFSNLVAMKARGPNPPAGVTPGWAYMKTLMRELMSAANPPPGGGSAIDRNIEQMIGENPSYYAQMDILTKKIFQNPNFYTNLYDKPVNVDRINASLEAIATMQMRDHYLASLRREMLLSGLIENQLITDAEAIQGKLLEQ